MRNTVIPLDALTAAGMILPPADTLDDAALHELLWKLLNAIADDHAIFVTHTDHLSDRELYEYLLKAIEEPIPAQEDWMAGPPGTFLDPLGGGSAEDRRTLVRYYIEGEERDEYIDPEIDGPAPPFEKPPYDRDRLLPG